MSNFVDVILYISYVVIFLCAVLFVKNIVTFRNHNVITDAIFHYNIHKISLGEPGKTIDYDCAEHYYITLFKMWDWGYKNIVPREVFEAIKPYIGKETNITI